MSLPIKECWAVSCHFCGDRILLGDVHVDSSGRVFQPQWTDKTVKLECLKCRMADLYHAQEITRIGVSHVTSDSFRGFPLVDQLSGNSIPS
jgi:hypothetical protein